MTTTTKQDWLNDPTGTTTAGPASSISPTGWAPGARTVQGGLPTPKFAASSNQTTDWLNAVTSRVINRVAVSAARQLTCIADRQPIPLIYGEDRVGALVLNVVPFVWGGVDSVMVQCLWGHACDSMPGEPTYNDDVLPVGYGHAFYNGYGPHSVWSQFSTAFYNASGGIPYTDTLSGFAVSYIIIPGGAFNGALGFTATLRGRRVFDPRNGRLPEWSDNPSLCTADFLTNFCLKTVDYSSVGVPYDYTTLTHAANANDELVASERRRTLNVTFLTQSAKAIADTLRAYASCFYIPSANGIKLVPDRPTASTATYSHAAGSILALRLSKKDSGNFPTECELTYTNRTSLPWKDDSVYVGVDGLDVTVPRRLTSVNMPGINRYSQAKREAWERLNKLRTSDLNAILDVFDVGIRHEEGDVITVADHPVGLSNKLLRVGSIDLIGDGTWRLSCTEYDPAGYSDDAAVGPTYPDTHFTNPALPPSVPTGLAYAFGPSGIELTWSSNNELTVTTYELRKGSSWESGTPLIGTTPTIVGGTTFVWPSAAAAIYTVWIKAITSVGIPSNAAASITLDLTAPILAGVSYTLVVGNYLLEWSVGLAALPIMFFRVKKAGVLIAEVDSTSYTAPVDWSGSMTFTVQAVDIGGNEGPPSSVTITVTGPGPVTSFTSSVVQNTVLFYWRAPAIKPLPITSYEMRRGLVTDTWDTAINIGSKSGDQTFTTYFEGGAGEFKYFIRPIDTAGIAGPSTSLTQRVAGISNFQILKEWTSSTWTGAKVNAVVWDGKVVLPVNSVETFAQHFSGAYDTPQEQIDAGFPLYIEPSVPSGSYEEIFDFGAQLTTAMVTFNWDKTDIGFPVFTPHIDKSTNGVDWIEVGDVSQSVVGGFRFLRARITVESDGEAMPLAPPTAENTSAHASSLGPLGLPIGGQFYASRGTGGGGTTSDGNDLAVLNSISLRLDVQTETDGGSKHASDFVGSPAYCPVTFNKTFVDVNSITVTPMGTGTVKRYWMVEFVDEPNPTTCKVWFWDEVGTVTPTDFSWTVVGVI